MSTTSLVPAGYRLKRIGRPVRGERILGRHNEVLTCQGDINVVCAIIEPVGGAGYEASREQARRDYDRRRNDSPQDEELMTEG